MNGRTAPARLIWALGATQTIGYGSLYYSFSILAPDMAREFSIPVDRLFGLLSAALVVAGLLAPKAGRWADRYGAGRLMVPGSLAAGLSLAVAAAAPSVVVFGAALIAMEVSSTFVLYSTAFAAIVQTGAANAQKSITHLTLIAGFASTLFWPLTATLHQYLDWRAIYLIFALLNILVCLPVHRWAGRLPHFMPDTAVPDERPSAPDLTPGRTTPADGIFILMLAAFTIEGLVLASILVHMVPLMTVLGVGSAGLMVSALFGPSQVASRLLNMIFGGRLSQTTLAVISAGLLAAALAVLVATNARLPGLVVFAILFGLGSGLASIVGGTLPLELFGRNGYGARLGWVTAAKQFSSALAPFAFAMTMTSWGAPAALTASIVTSAVAFTLFGAIMVLRRRAPEPDGPMVR